MRHHYVPKFLLKAWADTSSDGMVEVFRLDLPGLRSQRWAPKATGYEPDLYALTMSSVAGIDQQAVETEFLQHLDDSAAKVLHKLAATGFSDLSKGNRATWVCFIMSLLSRTPESIDLIREAGCVHLNASLIDQPEEYDALADASDPSTLTDLLEAHLPGFIKNFGMLSLRPGGRGQLPTRGSHGSGRAPFGHPAPQIMVSLLNGTHCARRAQGGGDRC